MTPSGQNGLRPARIVTLGCRLNQADSALLADRLSKLGYLVQPEDAVEAPEVIIVNSCAVTAVAASKSRQAARRMKRLYPEAKIIFTGCAAELDEEGSTEFTTLSNVEKRILGEALHGFAPGHRTLRSRAAGAERFLERAEGLFPYRTRAFVKIQEGCDNFCTYCIVPYTRGASRSRDFAEVVAECRNAVARGVPEVVITGVNTCNYFDSGHDLESLIETLCTTIPGDWRLRLSSTEPTLDNQRLLEVMAKYQDKVCRFLHLALQHGSDRILRLMHRKYTTRDYRMFVERARELIPDIHLGSDVIVGFPGETEQDFEESYGFIKSLNFANLHVFSYSKRSGTPAAEMPDQVPEAVKKIRHERLEMLAEAGRKEFTELERGKELPVIFETVDNAGMAHGWSDNYIAVSRPAESVPRGRIIKITL